MSKFISNQQYVQVLSELPTLNLPKYIFKTTEVDGLRKIFCTFRKKWVRLTPEEWVRQNFCRLLIDDLDYPASRTKLEQKISLAGRTYLADIVVYDKAMNIHLIVECKRTETKLDQNVFRQIGIYNHGIGGVRYLMITNGIEHYALIKENNSFKFLVELPKYKETEINP